MNIHSMFLLQGHRKLEEGMLNPNNTTADFPAKISRDSLEHIAQDVYADGRFAYKFNYRAAWLENPRYLPEEVIALRKVRGLPGVQQLVGFRDGVIITQLVRGSTLRTPIQPSPSHVGDLVRDYVSLRKKLCGFEAHSGNLVYDCQEGFTLIDLSLDSTVPISIGPLVWPLYCNELVQRAVGCDRSERACLFFDIVTKLLEELFSFDPALARENLIPGGKPIVLKADLFYDLVPGSAVFKNLQKLIKKCEVNLQEPTSYEREKVSVEFIDYTTYQDK